MSTLAEQRCTMCTHPPSPPTTWLRSKCHNIYTLRQGQGTQTGELCVHCSRLPVARPIKLTCRRVPA